MISKTSLRTLLGTAALVSFVSAFAQPASAELSHNGTQVNGVELNGTQINGVGLNALIDNGVAAKGTSGEAIARPEGVFDFGSLTVVGVTPAAAR